MSFLLIILQLFVRLLISLSNSWKVSLEWISSFFSLSLTTNLGYSIVVISSLFQHYTKTTVMLKTNITSRVYHQTMYQGPALLCAIVPRLALTWNGCTLVTSWEKCRRRASSCLCLTFPNVICVCLLRHGYIESVVTLTTILSYE